MERIGDSRRCKRERMDSQSAFVGVKRKSPSISLYYSSEGMHNGLARAAAQSLLERATTATE